jgi:hypothetical protein
MDPFLLISGALALVGGGAGAYAWYKKNYTAAGVRDAAIAASGNAYTGPLVPASYATPAAAHNAKVAASGTAYTGAFVPASSTPDPNRSTPTSGPGSPGVVAAAQQVQATQAARTQSIISGYEAFV